MFYLSLQLLSMDIHHIQRRNPSDISFCQCYKIRVHTKCLRLNSQFAPFEYQSQTWPCMRHASCPRGPTEPTLPRCMIPMIANRWARRSSRIYHLERVVQAQPPTWSLRGFALKVGGEMDDACHKHTKWDNNHNQKEDVVRKLCFFGSYEQQSWAYLVSAPCVFFLNAAVIYTYIHDQTAAHQRRGRARSWISMYKKYGNTYLRSLQCGRLSWYAVS